MTEPTTLAYLAGILDADGYFTIKRSTYSQRVRGDARVPVYSEKVGIKQVTPQAIDLLHSIFGGYRRVEKPTATNGQPLHAWSVTAKKAADVVDALMPYLRIKVEQANALADLRRSLNAPRSETHRRRDIPTVSRNRWGEQSIHRLEVSPETIAAREALWRRVKEINDTRVHPAFAPK